jgi:hypothetical protein
MTPQGAKAKGRFWENRIVAYLTSAGWPYTERRRLAGTSDRGDIAGIPGVIIEAKSAKTYSLPAWMKETRIERNNAKAAIGALWIKANGKTDAGEGFVLLPPEDFVRLLREAGYGPPWVDSVPSEPLE